VPTPRQHHHKEPGLLCFACVVVDNLGAFTEIDLRRFTGFELQYGGGFGLTLFDQLPR